MDENFEYGKLDFSVSLRPTSAFPLDGRILFSSLTDAELAAQSAEEPGSTNTRYYYGQKLLVVTAESAKWYTIQQDKTLRADDGVAFEPGHGLELTGGVLNVLTAHEPEPDNTLPITAAAVDTVVGNIEILLKTI